MIEITEVDTVMMMNILLKEKKTKPNQPTPDLLLWRPKKLFKTSKYLEYG